MTTESSGLPMNSQKDNVWIYREAKKILGRDPRLEKLASEGNAIEACHDALKQAGDNLQAQKQRAKK